MGKHSISGRGHSGLSSFSLAKFDSELLFVEKNLLEKREFHEKSFLLCRDRVSQLSGFFFSNDNWYIVTLNALSSKFDDLKKETILPSTLYNELKALTNTERLESLPQEKLKKASSEELALLLDKLGKLPIAPQHYFTILLNNPEDKVRRVFERILALQNSKLNSSKTVLIRPFKETEGFQFSISIFEKFVEHLELVYADDEVDLMEKFDLFKICQARSYQLKVFDKKQHDFVEDLYQRLDVIREGLLFQNQNLEYLIPSLPVIKSIGTRKSLPVVLEKTRVPKPPISEDRLKELKEMGAEILFQTLLERANEQNQSKRNAVKRSLVPTAPSLPKDEFTLWKKNKESPKGAPKDLPPVNIVKKRGVSLTGLEFGFHASSKGPLANVLNASNRRSSISPMPKDLAIIKETYEEENAKSNDEMETPYSAIPPLGLKRSQTSMTLSLQPLSEEPKPDEKYTSSRLRRSQSISINLNPNNPFTFELTSNESPGGFYRSPSFSIIRNSSPSLHEGLGEDEVTVYSSHSPSTGESDEESLDGSDDGLFFLEDIDANKDPETLFNDTYRPHHLVVIAPEELKNAEKTEELRSDEVRNLFASYLALSHTAESSLVGWGNEKETLLLKALQLLERDNLSTIDLKNVLKYSQGLTLDFSPMEILLKNNETLQTLLGFSAPFVEKNHLSCCHLKTDFISLQAEMIERIQQEIDQEEVHHKQIEIQAVLAKRKSKPLSDDQQDQINKIKTDATLVAMERQQKEEETLALLKRCRDLSREELEEIKLRNTSAARLAETYMNQQIEAVLAMREKEDLSNEEAAQLQSIVEEGSLSAEITKQKLKDALLSGEDCEGLSKEESDLIKKVRGEILIERLNKVLDLLIFARREAVADVQDEIEEEGISLPYRGFLLVCGTRVLAIRKRILRDLMNAYYLNEPECSFKPKPDQNDKEYFHQIKKNDPSILSKEYLNETCQVELFDPEFAFSSEKEKQFGLLSYKLMTPQKRKEKSPVSCICNYVTSCFEKELIQGEKLYFLPMIPLNDN